MTGRATHTPQREAARPTARARLIGFGRALRTPLRLGMVVAACLMASGCYRYVAEYVAGADITAFSERAENALFDKDEATVRALMGEQFATNVSSADMQRLFAAVPERADTSKLLKASKEHHDTNTGEVVITSLVREVKTPNGPTLLNMTVVEMADEMLLEGAFLKLVTPEERAQVGFSLTDKTTTHYVMLGATALCAFLTVLALVVCWFTGGLKRRLLWTMFIVLGFFTVGMNWSTGAVFVLPLNLTIFSASFFKMPYEPATITLAIPLGALVFFYRKARGRLAMKGDRDAPAREAPVAAEAAA